MSDDHCARAIGNYGSHLAKLNPTPNLDALARNGIVFDNVFCTNSICTPSRASILTGQYSHRNGVYDLYDTLPGERNYLPKEMKKVGYTTAVIGKWHLKDSPKFFDYYSVIAGQGRYMNPTIHVSEGGTQRRVRFDSTLFPTSHGFSGRYWPARENLWCSHRVRSGALSCDSTKGE